ncbi:MAG: hypothetical protein FJ279_13595, partial [Planctomycetes bacterium]|nr:hypothetical protein [Planctomycetota bacterium]
MKTLDSSGHLGIGEVNVHSKAEGGSEMRERAFAVLTVLWLFSLWCWAQPAEVKGKVVTTGGKPVAEAEVYLIRQDPESRKQVLAGSAKSDERGEFSFRRAGSGAEAPPREVTIAAWHPALAIGWAAYNPSKPKDITIRLEDPPSELNGKVRDLKGKPVGKARVFPHYIARGSGVWFPEELAQKWATLTTATGEFDLRLCPSRASVGIIVEATGFARQEVSSFNLKEELDVTVWKGSVVQGQVQCEDPKAGVSNLTVQSNTKAKVYKAVHTKTDENGRFVLKDVMPGEVSVDVYPAAQSQWLPESDHRFTLAEGENKDGLVFRLKKATKVSGRVVESGTGQPLAGLNIYANTRPGGYISQVAKTDKEGAYSFYALPGEVQVHQTGSGQLPIWRDDQRQTIHVGSEPVTVPDFKSARLVAVTGSIVDEKGNPVGGVEVTYGTRPGPFPSWERRWVRSDGKGAFRIPDLLPDAPITAQARTGTGFSDSVTFVPRHQKEPIRLVVKQGSGVRLKGRVIDTDGQPISGADVVLSSHSDRAMMTGLVRWKTGRNGSFESDLLSADSAYSAHVWADKHSPASTTEWQAEAGKTHDFGDIVLRKEAGVLAGRVVDSKGNPVAGARVWNAGDASKLIETQSGAKGEFRLEGLREGYAYAFAEKEGYRLAGLRAKIGSDDLVLKLYGTQEQPEIRVLSPPLPPTRGRVAELVPMLADIGLRQAEREKNPQTRDYYRPKLIAALAQVDPLKAKTLSAQAGGKYDADIALALASQSVKKNTEEAIAYLNSVPNGRDKGYRVVCMTEDLARQDPEKARLLLPQALLVVRALQSVQDGTALLPRLAKVMKDIGMTGSREILADCAAKARNFGADGDDAYARGVVAQELYEFDPEAALELLKPLRDGHHRARPLVNIARRMAAKDPDRAVALIEQAKEASWEKPRLCHRLAETDLARAERL